MIRLAWVLMLFCAVYARVNVNVNVVNGGEGG